MLAVIDASLLFKDQVVRHKCHKIAAKTVRQLAAARSANTFNDALIKKVRRAKKCAAKVICDVIVKM